MSEIMKFNNVQYSPDETVAPSPLFAETLAARLAVQLALSLQATNFIFELDSLQLVNLLNHSSSSIDWAVLPLVDHIRFFTVDLPSHSWVWASRSSNQAAHHIACLAHRSLCPLNWVQQPPLSSAHLLFSDVGHAPM